MSNVVITSPPVVVTSQEPEHPVVTHKKKLFNIGVTQIIIGFVTGAFGIYNVAMTHNLVAVIEIAAGMWFAFCGSLAVSASKNPISCNVSCGIAVAILASLVAFVVLFRACFGLAVWISTCRIFACRADLGAAPISILILISFVEFILAIVHASYSCMCCCGRHSAPTQNSAMALTPISVPAMQSVVSYETGNAAFTDPPGEKIAYTAYPPQANAYSPAYN